MDRLLPVMGNDLMVEMLLIIAGVTAIALMILAGAAFLGELRRTLEDDLADLDRPTRKRDR